MGDARSSRRRFFLSFVFVFNDAYGRATNDATPDPVTAFPVNLHAHPYVTDRRVDSIVLPSSSCCVQATQWKSVPLRSPPPLLGLLSLMLGCFQRFFCVSGLCLRVSGCDARGREKGEKGGGWGGLLSYINHPERNASVSRSPSAPYRQHR